METSSETTMDLVEAAQLRLLDPRTLRLFQAGATLRMTIEGESSWLKVTVLRAFPLTQPTRYFSVRDGGGKEIGVLAGLDGLDAGSRFLIEAEIERRYMVSVIHRIVSVKERFGTVEWDVETHRGRCRFTTRDMRENCLRPSPGHYLITDVENNRFEILDLESLDPASQAALLRHL
ncbi:MAG: DUF1854 domain-containing protein [bacterium]